MPKDTATIRVKLANGSELSNRDKINDTRLESLLNLLWKIAIAEPNLSLDEIKDRAVKTYQERHKSSILTSVYGKDFVQSLANQDFTFVYPVIQSIQDIHVVKGNVYNVSIPENYELLDWNNTLDNQPEKITHIINRIIDTLHKNPAEIAAFGYSSLTDNPQGNQKELERIISELVPIFREFEDKHKDNHKYKSKNGGYAWMDLAHFKRIPQYKQLRAIIHDTKILEGLFGTILNLSNNNSSEAKINTGWTGESLYWTLADLTGSPINASMYLNSLDIPGHRYWDKGSRDNQQGTHNFVIWNTDRLKIVGVEGDKEAVDYFRNTILQKLTGNPNETYNQVIGEKGAELIDRAIGANWLTGNLALAKKMELLAFKPRHIRRVTGWELGHEGKWKFEVPDGSVKDNLRLEATEPNFDPFEDNSIFAELPFGCKHPHA